MSLLGERSGFGCGDGAQNPIIGQTAVVAADLHRVGEIAEAVSLAAKNAQLIAARIGERGRAFEPITSYIDEITRSAQSGTEQVEAMALQLTRIATRYLRTVDTYRRYGQVLERADQACHVNTLRPAVESRFAALTETRGDLERLAQTLRLQLQDLDLHMRAALVVAAICRVEAARAGDLNQSLGVVADELESAAHEVQGILRKGLKCVEIIRGAVRE